MKQIATNICNRIIFMQQLVMKNRVILISFLILFLLSSCCSLKTKTPPKRNHKNNEGYVYDSVVIIGVDGVGSFFNNTDTPNIDRIFKDGAVSDCVYVFSPTMSAEGWGSILHGVEPEYHGMTNFNTGSGSYPYPSTSPTVFSVVREQMPNAVIASIVNWPNFNRGMIEDNIGVIEETYKGDDRAVTDAVLSIMDENYPTLLFVDFDSADAMGHKKGFGKEKQLEVITTLDGYIGEIYEKIKEKDKEDSTLFIVATDHGGKKNGWHGDDTNEEKYVFMGIKGKTINKDAVPAYTLCDITPVITYALGLKSPEYWMGTITDNLFLNL